MYDIFLSAALALTPVSADPAHTVFMPNMVLAHDGAVDTESCHPGRERGRMHCHPPAEVSELSE